MKKYLVISMVAAMCVLAFSCMEEMKEEQGPVVARVNEYCLGRDEFRDLLARDLRLEGDYKLTREAQLEFLDSLVTRQVLIQEAKRLRLDSQEKFICSVQRFWESTLIRDLMEIKAREIEETTLVTQEEVLTLYRAIKAETPGIPGFETMRSELFEQVLEEKKTELLAQWIKELQGQSRVEIDESCLFGQNAT